MRTKRRELKEQRLGRKPSSAPGDEVRRRQFAEGQLSQVDSYYELLKMIAGAGMGLAGGGAGMLRARRRDINLKPNRKLDRKSTRGMIFENEELRLRTIHFNAEVEQGQNDIKKLRRENEQLRREIWSLRDEYDKLEEMWKKQKTREESAEPEGGSGDEAAGSEYSEDDDDQDEEEDEEDEESESEEEEQEQEAKKKSPEKSNTPTSAHRSRVNFDNLPVVAEEEELKKDPARENKENRPENNQHPLQHQSSYPFRTTSFEQAEPLTTVVTTTAPPCFGYQTDSPFVFPALRDHQTPVTYSNILDAGSFSMTSQKSTAELPRLGFDIGPHTSHPLGVAGSSSPPLLPPPPGWQSGLQTNFPTGVQENCDLGLGLGANLAERRRAFFAQGSRTFSLGVGHPAEGNMPIAQARSIDEGATRMIDESASNNDGRAKHFFAPLTSRFSFQTRSSDEASPGSDKTTSTVVSRSRFEAQKGSADVCVNGVIPNLENIEQGDAKTFFSTENLLGTDLETKSSGSSNPLTKSVSCQDLSSRLSFTETNLKAAKSDTTLDNISVHSKQFKSQLNVTLRQPSRKSLSPDIPEIPQLPSIDYKLFSNPFLQNFEQAYQNFPLRAEGQSPVSHPLSIQVCESPVSGASYSSPVRMQPSFGSCPPDSDCASCRRRDDRLRLTIPPSGDKLDVTTEYQVTSFETPSPHTLQIPPMTPYELDSLRQMPTGTSPQPTPSRLYQNVPFVPRGASVYGPGQQMYYGTVKVPAQTQTSPEDEVVQEAKSSQSPDVPKKRRSRKEKSGGSVKEKRLSQRKGPKKQNSVAVEAEVEAKADESRSSSTGRESPRKETKRVSLYFNSKKRPSLSSSRSRSIDRERTNSVSSREQQPLPIPAVIAAKKDKARRNSTSSGSVPWCACWGNGCV